MVIKKLFLATICLTQLSAYAADYATPQKDVTADLAMPNLAIAAKKKRDISLISMFWNGVIKLGIGTELIKNGISIGVVSVFGLLITNRFDATITNYLPDELVGSWNEYRSAALCGSLIASPFVTYLGIRIARSGLNGLADEMLDARNVADTEQYQGNQS